MRQSIAVRALFFVALQILQPTSISGAFVKPLPPVDDDTVSAGLVKKAVAEKTPYLVGAAFVALVVDPIVHKFFNHTELKQETGRFKLTAFFNALDSIDLGAKAYGLTLLADLVQTLIPRINQLLPFQVDLFEAALPIGLIIFGASFLSDVKQFILHKLVHGTRLGMVEFVDKLGDLALGVGAVYNILHVLKWEIGKGFKSIFAASGSLAIVFSLASKGMVENMFNGMLLNVWDAIEVGDDVLLGDGTEGTIIYFGLLETEVMGSDHVPIRVPNSRIVGKRVHMYSKVTQSQVKQTLRFKYPDLSKLPTLLEDIKKEIESCCKDSRMMNSPKVRLTGYEADHIQVSVSCSFDMPPDAEFEDVREKVLFAIADAVTKNDVDFALPAILYETKGSSATILQAT